jgi:hypothetical protein
VHPSRLASLAPQDHGLSAVTLSMHGSLPLAAGGKTTAGLAAEKRGR